MAKDVIITGSNISFGYDRDKIFDNVSFDIFDREFLGIIGPNGGGKTTFVKILLGMLRYAGQILYPSAHIFCDRKDIGYVPQNTHINISFPIMALEVVEMGFIKKGMLGFRVKTQQRKRALDILDKLGIAHVAYKKISELSGGQLQRVLIARAIISDPKLLILDEPTSNIDPKAQTEIYQILKSINKFHTIITVSHDIPITLEYATRILHINRAIHTHDVPQVTLNRDGHLCEIDIFQNFLNNNFLGAFNE